MSFLLGGLFYVVMGYLLWRALPAVRADVARLRGLRVVKVRRGADGGL